MDGQRIPFTREDEERISSAALWGIIAAITSIVAGLLDVVIKVIQGRGLNLVGVFVGAAVGLTITIVLGIFLLQACGAFRKVALTDEADERYLLEGFEKLRLYFKVLGIILIVVISLAGVAMLGLMMCRMSF
jgi:hypothetical protein